MQFKLTADSAGRIQMVRSGKEIDDLFESVMFLSEYAHDMLLPDVAMRLEDVLDSILRLEGRVDNEVMAKVSAVDREKSGQPAVSSTERRRRLVTKLHGEDRLAS